MVIDPLNWILPAASTEEANREVCGQGDSESRSLLEGRMDLLHLAGLDVLYFLTEELILG